MNTKIVRELTDIINKHSLENGSDTPDFILAEYLVSCLLLYNRFMTNSDENPSLLADYSRIVLETIDKRNNFYDPVNTSD